MTAYRAVAMLDDTDPAEVHYRLAKLLSQAGKRDEARREVLKSLEEAPRFLDAHRLLLELVEHGEKPADYRRSSRPARPEAELTHETTDDSILFAIPVLLAIASGVAVAQFADPGRRPADHPRGPGRRAKLAGRRAIQARSLHVRPDRIQLGMAAAGCRSGGGMGPGFGGGWRRGRRVRGAAVGSPTGPTATSISPSASSNSPRSRSTPIPITLKLTDTGTLRLSVHLHDRARPTVLLRGRGRGSAPVSPQRRLPHGRRLLGRRSSGITSISRSSGCSPRPDEPEELPLDHEIFQCVYRLKEKPQVPSIRGAWWGRDSGHHLGKPRRRLRRPSITRGSRTIRAG